MRRSAFLLGFTLAFTAVIALAVGSSAAAPDEAAGYADAAQEEVRTATSSRIDAPVSTPYVFEAIDPDPAHNPFLRLMPDGTYCGVGCPDENP